MTRDQNGTWEMESNDNFEGYMKALGKGAVGGGRGRTTSEGLWSGPPDSATMEFTDLSAGLTPRLLAMEHRAHHTHSLRLRVLFCKLGIVVTKIVSRMSA